MEKGLRRSGLLLGALLGFGFALGGGCMNGALHNYKARIGAESPGRFALVIEADRTLVQGTHFLVDTATGDVWRMDVPDGRSGTWVRLSDAPADAARLEDSEEAEDGDA